MLFQALEKDNFVTFYWFEYNGSTNGLIIFEKSYSIKSILLTVSVLLTVEAINSGAYVTVGCRNVEFYFFIYI